MSDSPLCKLYILDSLYTHPCQSSDVGIFSARVSGTKSINKSLLLKRAIICNTGTIYDNSIIIIQAIQHLF